MCLNASSGTEVAQAKKQCNSCTNYIEPIIFVQEIHRKNDAEVFFTLTQFFDKQVGGGLWKADHHQKTQQN